MDTHSSILTWRIPWTEEPGRLQFMGYQRVRQDWTTFTHSFKFRFNKNISDLRDKHVSLAQEVPVIIHFLYSSTHTYTCGLLYIRALQCFLLLIIVNSDKMVALILQFCALNVTMRETTGLMWSKGNKVLEKPALFNTMKIVFTYFH